MAEVNHLAVVLAALSAVALAVVWYAPLFGKQWEELTGLTAKSFESKNAGVFFGTMFLLDLVAAYLLALFLGPSPETRFAAAAGGAIGLCWVATSLGVVNLIELRPFGLWLINAGYFTLAFALIGVVLAEMG